MQRESLRYPSCPCFGRWSVSGVRDTVFPITTGYLLSIGNEHVWLGWFEILIFLNIQTSTVQRSHLDISFIHLISSHLISSHLISSHLISSHLISSHLISSHLISSHLISSHLISSHHISSHLISLFAMVLLRNPCNPPCLTRPTPAAVTLLPCIPGMTHP